MPTALYLHTCVHICQGAWLIEDFCKVQLPLSLSLRRGGRLDSRDLDIQTDIQYEVESGNEMVTSPRMATEQ